jgi:hypothetical protein
VFILLGLPEKELRGNSEHSQSGAFSSSPPVSGGARLQRRIGVIIWSTGA